MQTQQSDDKKPCSNCNCNCDKGDCQCDKLVNQISPDGRSGVRPQMVTAVKPKGEYTIGPVAKSGGKKVKISLRGPIGGMFGINARDFIRDLSSKASNAKEIQVFINSGGGDVFDATAIFNALERHKATVTTTVEGVAASAATLIAQAGDVREMAENAYYMVHEVRGGIYGTRNELQSYLKLLDIANDNISKLYAKRSGTKKEQVDSLMLNGDNWLSNQEVIEHGFVDKLVGERQADPVVQPNAKLEINWTQRGAADLVGVQSEINQLVASVGTLYSEDTDVNDEPKGNKVFEKWLKAQGVDVTELSETEKKAWMSLYNSGGVQLDNPPVKVEDSDDPDILKLQRKIALRKVAGDDDELLLEALNNNWSSDYLKLKVENKQLSIQQTEQPQDELWAGSFVIPSNAKDTVMQEDDSIIAALCAQFKEVEIEDLLDPFRGLSLKDRMQLEKNTNICPISEKAVEAGLKAFTGTIQELAGYCCWRDGKQRNIWQFDDVNTVQNSFSSITFPARFKEVCERAMLAGFRMMAPKWNQLAFPVTVNDLQRHNQYRLYGTGRWEKKNTCGELTHGEVSIEPAHFNQAETHGQVLEICRDLVINNQIGPVNRITSRFAMMGRMAPEWGVWDFVNDNLCGSTPFEFTIANLEKMWECFCKKGQFELSGVPKDLCENFRIAIEMGNPRLLVAKCDKLKIMKILRGRIELCGDSETACHEHAVLDAILNDMLDVCESSYLDPGCVVMIPAPNPVGSVIELAFLRGRQLPTVNTVSLANNKLGFGLQGYIDFGVNATANPFYCNQDIINEMCPPEDPVVQNIAKEIRSR